MKKHLNVLIIIILNFSLFVELHTLTLWNEPRKDADPEDDQEGTSLISDLLFRHGLLQMTKLRNLYLYNKFQVGFQIF